MSNETELACRCGKVRLKVAGAPMVSVECCCTSCRAAGSRLEKLSGALPILTTLGTTPFVLYRKDRVRIASGAEYLKSFRLSPQATTRRVIASCCNAPVFLEFQGGHWLSLYATLWPEGARPRIEMRTMAGDMPDASVLPDDVPNLKSHSPGFYWKLFAAWAAMGFRNPKIDVKGELDVQ
jgi:hypothetical protein